MEQTRSNKDVFCKEELAKISVTVQTALQILHVHLLLSASIKSAPGCDHAIDWTSIHRLYMMYTTVYSIYTCPLCWGRVLAIIGARI